MKADDLKRIMNEYCNDIVFLYAGKNSGVTCEVHDYVPMFQAWHGEDVKLYDSLDEAMNDKFYSGKSINELLGIVDIDIV